MSMKRQAIVCRQIVLTDKDAVADLLASGFPERSRAFWGQALQRLADHDTPLGFPRFGYVLAEGKRWNV